MKNEIKLNKYQKELLESDKRLIICDWDRGLGKSYGTFAYIHNKCVKDKTNVLYIGFNPTVYCKMFNDFICKNKLKDYIEYIEGYDFVYYNKSKIYFRNKSLNINTLRGLYNFDYIIFDDSFSIENLFKFKDYINYSTKIIITLSSNKNPKIDIFSYKNNDGNCYENEIEENKINNITIESFKDKSIKKLMKEYLNMESIERTSMTRERILGMIKTINELK